jgi:hypothetical protein
VGSNPISSTMNDKGRGSFQDEGTLLPVRQEGIFAHKKGDPEGSPTYACDYSVTRSVATMPPSLWPGTSQKI